MARGIVFLLVMLISSTTTAQSDSFAEQMRASQQALEQLRMQAEISRLQIEAARQRAELARREDEDPARLSEQQRVADLAAKAEKDAKAAAQRAEDQAEEARMQVHMASVRTTNNIYLMAMAACLLAFAVITSRAARKDSGMKYEQKFGVIILVGAMLAAMFAVTASSGWTPQLDLLQNVMLTLRIEIFQDSEPVTVFRPASYLIDIPTKLVLAFIALLAAYGFTTYLGITPAWKNRPASPPVQAD